MKPEEVEKLNKEGVYLGEQDKLKLNSIINYNSQHCYENR
jgi:hypothetical protein